MNKFISEFTTLNYIIKKSFKILLVAHNGPDSDTTGSTLALKEYLENKGKIADVICFDPFPDYLKNLLPEKFKHPDHLNLQSYEAIIACDSVERGFDKIKKNLSEKQVVVLIDHHPDIVTKGDVNIIDAAYSSVCEIIYDFFEFNKTEITKNVATCLLAGILGDTGNFKHANTSARVLEIASLLMKKGAHLQKIIDTTFANKKISTLKLWGIAFEKAKINAKNGMIMTVLTQNDIKQCNASTDDVAQVSSILSTVPGVKFSLVLSEREDGTIRGSLRSEEYKNTDVSEIAHRFGGGGHKLASGFEIKGKIMETENGWKIA